MVQHTKSGFTLIEILIVIGITAILMALSMPFVTSLRADISRQQTLRQVKVDLASTLNYSLAGKSFGAIAAHDLMNSKFIPEAYALYFQRDSQEGSQIPYIYLEFAPSDSAQVMLKPSYQKENDYPNSTVFLKEITLLNQKESSQIKVDSAYIFILPPLGKIVFLNENLEALNHITQEELEKSVKAYDQIKLTFQYKDDERNFLTLTFDKNKILNIT